MTCTPMTRRTLFLEETTHELQKTIKEKNKVCEEKDEEIKGLQFKMDSMGIQYETVLMVSSRSYTRLSPRQISDIIYTYCIENY